MKANCRCIEATQWTTDSNSCFSMFTIVVYSQNVGFGLPSTFDWMEKYVTSSDIGNPFDIFDPFANDISAKTGLLFD